MSVVRSFHNPEKMHVHEKVLNGYLSGVTNSSIEKYLSGSMNNRKGINENKINALKKIDDNVRDAIIQHYDYHFDLELVKVIDKLFDVRNVRNLVKCDIGINAEPVDSMEIWENRLCAMSKNVKWHEVTANLMRRKVLKHEAVCYQQQWLSCTDAPTTMVKQ